MSEVSLCQPSYDVLTQRANSVGRYTAGTLEAIRDDAMRDSVKWGVGRVRGVELGAGAYTRPLFSST